MNLHEQFKHARPSGGFKVILADPPWPWNAFSPNGMGKSPEQHYDTMPVDEIAKLQVDFLASKDCALFIWCTWPMMSRWMDVINGWGFEYASLAWEWLKFNPETEKYSFGPGYGTRKNVEPCLLATRGNPSIKKDVEFFGNVQVAEGSRSVRDFIISHPLDAIRAQRREHSRKPDEQYNRIETLFDGPYCEIFSRSGRAGWTSIGNEVGKFEASA